MERSALSLLSQTIVLPLTMLSLVLLGAGIYVLPLWLRELIVAGIAGRSLSKDHFAITSAVSAADHALKTSLRKDAANGLC